MIYLPPLRRLLLPTLIVLAVILFYKSSFQGPTPFSSLDHAVDPQSQGVRVPISKLRHHMLPLVNKSSNHLSPPKEFYYTHRREHSGLHKNGTSLSSSWTQPALNPSLAVLFKCPTKPNRFTNHIRLNHIVRNISMIPPPPGRKDMRVFFNPTIVSLPYWSENQYLVVTRVLTEGNHQENELCEANICSPDVGDRRAKEDIPCTDDDIAVLGPAGGMRCATEPIVVSVPPTPAEKCEGKLASYVDLPGFHDPRIFWSGRGEPLMTGGTHSQYACFGLWIIDLRALYQPLETLLASSPGHPSLGPLMSYPSLTELTRNPAGTRSAMEKNWMIFFTDNEAYVHYEIAPQTGRSFAKLIGGGLTTTNLTDPLEEPCLADEQDPNIPGRVKEGEGTWHQATNSLRLILCERADAGCKPDADNTVFFAVVHRKQLNDFWLPMRYERYLIIWSAVAPFSMLGVSQHPILMANETASGWSATENWDDDPQGSKDPWAYFTYTVSIAYAWGRQGDEVVWKNTGFLDDEVVLGVGIDDLGLGFARVPARELLQCMRACPGRVRGGTERSFKWKE